MCARMRECVCVCVCVSERERESVRVLYKSYRMRFILIFFENVKMQSFL